MVRIDVVRGIEQATVPGLLDEPVEDIVDDVFEVGENGINRNGNLSSPKSYQTGLLEILG
ncbi:hypothetical protein [Halosegnis rubeus]|uniref:Uncharacterized protein n=1 Tax=Halosegnis rubeus TaxID=2212850 RepID=A0A5N5UKU6_9EURY|nr:hypothetical protein [Halosegnis rubeus]KAB7519439.1 hypothetical protein DP108_04875 [Halosegnis rubeus]